MSSWGSGGAGGPPGGSGGTGGSPGAGNGPPQFVPSEPYSKYEDMRSNPYLPFEAPPGSVVMKVRDNVTDEDVRLLHLASFLPITIPGATDFDEFGRPIRRPVTDSFVYWDVGGFLGMIHFNQRDPTGVPDLADRIANCNVKLTMEMHDSQLSPIESSKQLYPHLFSGENATLRKPMLAGVMGSVFDTVSKAIGVLAGVAGIPFVSPGEAGSYFEEQHTNVPTFARTIPGNVIYASAAAELLKHWNVTHAGFIYTQDDYGRSFLEELTNVARRYGISLVTASYFYVEGTGSEDSLREALYSVRNSRYLIGIGFGESVEALINASTEYGNGDERVWIFPEVGFIQRPTYSVPPDNIELAKAIENLVVLGLEYPYNPSFIGEMASFKHNPSLLDLFLRIHPDKGAYALYNWTTSIPIPSGIAYRAYDAVMAMGIAACEAENEFFTGRELYEQITLRTSFDGLSGSLAFDPLTGNRRFEGNKFGFFNLRIDEERTDETGIRFTSNVALTLENQVLPDGTTKAIFEEATPFIFRDGTTVPPTSLPPITAKQNLLTPAVRGFGWALGALAMVLAVWLGVWTFVHRNNKMIRLSQPVFLGMLCVGAFLMASSVIFLGWQEPWGGLDFACMATPWLLTMGFSTAFSALFTKTWRINRLFQHAVELNRTNMKAKDVLGPFFIMTLVNAGLLTAWTVHSPLRWVRTPDLANVDEFGRSVSSYGACVGGNYSIWVPLVAFNFLMVVFANYQSYLGRNAPSEFNESYYLTLTMASLLECFLIGAPILFLVAGNPTSDFVLKAVLVAFTCTSILGPIYYSKFRARNRRVDREAWGSFLANAARNNNTSGASTGGRGPSRSHVSAHSLRSESNAETNNGGYDTVARIRQSIAIRERLPVLSGSEDSRDLGDPNVGSSFRGRTRRSIDKAHRSERSLAVIRTNANGPRRSNSSRHMQGGARVISIESPAVSEKDSGRFS